MIGLNILSANTKKIQDGDWIINGKSLQEHCKRLRYVEKPETLAGLDVVIPIQDPKSGGCIVGCRGV